MYDQFYNLSCRPFETSPDPKFLWLGDRQKDALAALRYGIWENKGFLLLTGAEGTGKTTLANALGESLGGNVEWAVISDPALERLDFYNAIAAGFGLETVFTSKVQFLIEFSHFLHKAYDEGKKVALIVDDAERLAQEMLEELRLLSNIEKAETKLINIVFFGQTEFNDVLVLPKNRAVRQRLALFVELEPLSVQETGDYIQHRAKTAEAPDKLFTAKAVNTIHRISGGNPRNINVLCAYSMVAGAVRGKKSIDHRLVEECLAKLGLPGHPARRELAALSADDRSLENFKAKFVTNGGIISSGATGSMIGEEKRISWVKYSLTALCLVAVGVYIWRPEQPQVKVESGVAPHSVHETQHSPSDANTVHNERAHEDTSVTNEKQAAALKNGILEKAYQQDESGEAAETTAATGTTGADDTTVAVPLGEINTAEEETETADSAPEAVPAATVQDTVAVDVSSQEASAIESQPESFPEVVIVSSEPESAGRDETAGGGAEQIRVAPVPEHAENIEAAVLPEPQQEMAQLPRIEGEKFILPLQANSLKLTREGRKNLEKMLEVLKSYPEARLLVKGYVSAKTNSPENIKLSADRAAAVRDTLLIEGLAADRIEIKGMGNQEPLASNSTKAGRAQNRRVEIVILAD